MALKHAAMWVVVVSVCGWLFSNGVCLCHLGQAERYGRFAKAISKAGIESIIEAARGRGIPLSEECAAALLSSQQGCPLETPASGKTWRKANAAQASPAAHWQVPCYYSGTTTGGRRMLLQVTAGSNNTFGMPLQLAEPHSLVIAGVNTPHGVLSGHDMIIRLIKPTLEAHSLSLDSLRIVGSLQHVHQLLPVCGTCMHVWARRLLLLELMHIYTHVCTRMCTCRCDTQAPPPRAHAYIHTHVYTHVHMQV